MRGDIVLKDKQGELEVSCINALAGASEVRTRVLSGLLLGHPSIDKSAYLTKCRVKDHSSLVKKVLDRRKNGKPTYDPTDARDIVGLRLLTLYRRDLPKLVSHFLNFIEAGLRDDLSLFAGRELKNSVEEVIIYTTAPVGDQVDNLIIDQFISRGFSVSNDGEDEGEETLEVRVERKQSRYSSIHIILWCRNQISGEVKHRIPMEVQIRTSLEDAWGEIDHWRYKAESMAEGEGDNLHLDSAKDQLKTLKTQLDACAESADTIAKQIEYATPAKFRTTANVSARSVNMGTLVDLSLGEDRKEKLVGLSDAVKEAFRQFSSGEFGTESGSGQELADDFARIGESFSKLATEVAGDQKLEASEKTVGLYYLRMEAALSFYWAGRVLGSNNSEAGLAEKADQYLSTSLAIYNELALDKKYAHDAILAYRIANVLTAQNQDELALVKLREAVSDLKEHPQDNLQEDHFLRVRIPRQLGVAYWEEAESLRIKAAGLQLEDHFIERRRTLYLDALRVTAPLLNVESAASESDMDLGAEERAEEKLKTSNNVLDYALCYLRAGGSLDVLETFQITQEKLLEFASLLEGEDGLDGLQIPVWGDTLRAAYEELFDDQEKATAAATATKKLIENNRKTFEALHGERIVQEMIEDADATLSR